MRDHIRNRKPHGKTWKIHNKELLMSEIVPEFFAQSKFESFTRQLNGWGFKRLQQPGNDHNAYYHENFQRGLQGLTATTKRESQNRGKLISRMEEEPNFYEINKQFPLSSSMTPRQSHPQYPPTQLKAGVSSRASQEHPPLFYHAMPNRFPPFPGVYGPPPPFYAAAYNHMSCYPHYPPRYPMHYG
jgi:hypothetical protein